MEHFRCKRSMLVLQIITAVLLMMMEGAHGITRPEDNRRTNIGVNNIVSGSGAVSGSGSGSGPGSSLDGMYNIYIATNLA